jgi:signal peptidase I
MSWRKAVEWLVTLGVAAAFVLVFEAEVAQPYRVPSSSMEPTLDCARNASDSGCTASFNDRVLAAKVVYRFRNPERGEIAVFHAPAAAKRDCGEGGVYLKRVIGLPGDVVSERDGIVYIDGKRLSEPYIVADERDTITKTWPRLGSNQYFMLGDNRSDSCDSRTWGPVARSAFIGPVVARYWPPNRWGVP